MAVDIKTLRIGSHVEYDGKRVRVALVRDDGCICEYKDNGQDVIVGLGIEKQPIPITSELLAELGFEYTSHDFGMWWQKKIGNRLCEIDECNDKWVIVYKGCDCAIRYLHEAEALLALHGVELIKE